MQSTSENIQNLLVIPCSCDSYLGRLPAAAVQALLQEKRVRRQIEVRQPDAPGLLQESSLQEMSIVAVDGCGDCCVQKQLAERNIKVEFYLNLAELALENRDTSEITEGDLQLAKDGIIASAARTSDFFPRVPGCCCG